MSETIALTGAVGFTGVHFVQAALSHGYRCVTLDANLTDHSGLVKELRDKDFDYIVHLAAISSVTHENSLAFYEVNLFGTLNLLAACRRMKNLPKKVLIASSANVYGNCEISPISEIQCPNPVNHYANSKLAMENMVKADEMFEERIVLTRPFNYTGVGQDNRFLIPKLVEAFAQKKLVIELGNIEVEREFNDVRDVCGSYLRLLKRGATGTTYNICSGKPYRLSDVIEKLNKICGYKIEIEVNPAYVREGEVFSLYGDAAKLEKHTGVHDRHDLNETLSWMLNKTPDLQ